MSINSSFVVALKTNISIATNCVLPIVFPFFLKNQIMNLHLKKSGDRKRNVP